ncbi:MAG: 50S ribosomal protein L21, partial [Patescibacteria group bacterium]
TQYLVSPKDEIQVPLMDQVEGALTLDDVLMILDGDKASVGQPKVTGASVKATVLGTIKGEKVRVFKFKAKSRYRKTRGFRAKFTTLRIDEVVAK